ncbi:MAG TPA: pentapeptide repeat-containing protein, partial [Longimicrobiaceae bacterium]|nr:pentapeptide repeat-containing protein [Longimicrobiaceae bacterium]
MSSHIENVPLAGADFRCADLSGAVFPAVDVTGADFSGANLCGANLKNAQNLSWWQLGATNLERAVLPPRFKLDGIQVVQTLAGRAEKLLLGILAACATTLILTLLTSHVQFFAPASAIDLPFLSVPVPIRAFYFVAPWLLLLTYCYLLATLLKLWSVLRETPRVLRHGKPVYEVISAYPNFSVAPFGRLWVNPCTNDSDRASSQKIRKAVRSDRLLLAALVWFPVPATLLGFWLSFLAAHDSMGSWLQGVAFVVSVVVSVLAYAEMVAILTRDMPWQNTSLLFSRYRSGRARKRKADRGQEAVQRPERAVPGQPREDEAFDVAPRLRIASIAVFAVLLGLGMRCIAKQFFNNQVVFDCRTSEDRFREQRTRCYWFAADLAHAKLESFVLHGVNLKRA